jgi:hypothetical protein
MSNEINIDKRAISNIYGKEIVKITAWSNSDKFTLVVKNNNTINDEEVQMVELLEDTKNVVLDAAQMADLLEKTIEAYYGEFTIKISSPYEILLPEKVNTPKDNINKLNTVDIVEKYIEPDEVSGKVHVFTNNTKCGVYFDLINSEYFKELVYLDEIDFEFEEKRKKLAILKMLKQLPEDKIKDILNCYLKED